VDVRLSEEQQALRDAAAQAVGRLSPKTVAELDDADRAAKLDDAVEASGWRELRVASEGSAPLASAVEVAIIAEELGRGLADAAFLGPTLAAELRRLCGAPEATERETVGLRLDLGGLASIDAEAATAIDAQGAQHALVLTGSGSRHGLGALPILAPEVEVDLTRPASGLDLAQALGSVDGSERLLDDDDLTRWLSLGLAITCADLVGTMRGTIDLARDYAQSRQQYGAHIGSFQAVQHMLADAYVSMEGSRSVALHAAWAVDALEPAEALLAASVAKAYCARAARSACEVSIQVHGGIGNTWECLAHVFLRRALVSSELFGGVDASLARVLAGSGLGGDHGLR
jgi:alkylation response protein AidB-like acyl-CoA dehydrogenase